MRDGIVVVLAVAAGIHNRRAAEPFFLHLLEVAGDGLFGDVPVEPPPIGIEASLAGWIVPHFFQWRGPDGLGQQQAHEKTVAES